MKRFFALTWIGIAVFGQLTTEEVAHQTGTVAITHAGDDRLFLTVKSGRIVIFDGTQILPTDFLDISSMVSSGGEQGLLSTAFHPDYGVNGYFYVNYTNMAGDTVIARYERLAGNPNQADPGSQAILMIIDQPFGNHNGGQLQFGPDGTLYVGMGDGGSSGDPACLAQNPQELHGKMLRLDVNQNMTQPPYHGIPADNPYVGDPLVLDEIWASGLRNPWRFSFDVASAWGVSNAKVVKNNFIRSGRLHRTAKARSGIAHPQPIFLSLWTGEKIIETHYALTCVMSAFIPRIPRMTGVEHDSLKTNPFCSDVPTP